MKAVALGDCDCFDALGKAVSEELGYRLVELKSKLTAGVTNSERSKGSSKEKVFKGR
jgi:hypothetical protein